MYVLSLDTTAKVASCAILKDSEILAEFTLNNGNTHTENILPMIDDMMKKCSLTIDDISLIAASAGPGSFTGVRIGASVAKGLAFDKKIMLAPVSTLEALAMNLDSLDGIICPVMDARRNQVYTALFCFEGEKLIRLSSDDALSLSDLYEKLKDLKEKIYFVGDGYEITKEFFKDKGLDICNTPLILRSENAISVAKIGLKMLKEGKCVTDKEFAPSYLRMSQAERERNEKLNINN